MAFIRLMRWIEGKLSKVPMIDMIFGCAGLKSAVRRLPCVPEGTLLLFLFGEIAGGRFANLMMTGLFPDGKRT